MNLVYPAIQRRDLISLRRRGEKMSKQCRRCKGSGKVCKSCELPIEKCFLPDSRRLKPCPSCSPTPEELDRCLSSKPKPRQIMIPARWESLGQGHGHGDLYCWYLLHEKLALIEAKSPMCNKYIIYLYDRHWATKTSLSEAQSAAERELGVEG
jgi:hypothetical protein